MRIRLYNRMDLDDVLKLYYDTVHNVCAQDYSLEELDAMAPEKPNIYHWETSLEKNHTIVAVNDEDDITNIYYSLFKNLGEDKFYELQNNVAIFKEIPKEFPDRSINMMTVISILYLSGFRNNELYKRSLKFLNQ